MNSALTLQFQQGTLASGLMPLNSTFSFKLRFNGSFVSQYTFKWVNSRTQQFELNRVSGNSGTGLNAANDFEKYAKIDLSGKVGIYGFDKLGDFVSILAASGYDFYDVTVSAGSSYINTTVNNVVAAPEFKVDSVNVIESDINKCDKVKIEINTTGNISSYQYKGSYVNLPSPSNQVYIEHDRDLLFEINLYYNENSVSQVIYYPLSVNARYINGLNSGLPQVPGENINIPRIKQENVSISVEQNVLSGNIIIQTFSLDELDLQYSINGIDYYENNTFLDQAQGDYIVYIKDQYNCIKQFNVTVETKGLVDPLLYISKANSLIFKENVIVDGLNILKNEDNTFDSNGFNQLNNCQPILFNSNQIITTQIKSTYSTIEVILRKDDGNEFNIPLLKQTSNLGRFDYLDCKLYKHSSGKIGVYFEQGNKYNQGGSIIDQYELNGNLPDFAIIGNNILIDYFGNFKIYDVIFDEQIQKKVILVNSPYTLAVPIDNRISCVYNLLDFDVYEFQIDFSSFGLGYFEVEVNATDENYEDKSILSEDILIQEIHENLLNIVYYNDESNNKDIFYKYGIRHFLNLEYQSYKPKPKDNTEIVTTDNETYVSKSNLNELDRIVFQPVTTSFVRKLSIALTSDNLFINNIGYAIEGSISVEDIENTNLSVIECDLIKTNITYSNIRNLDVGTDFGSEDLAIPSLLDVNSKFLKVKK